MGIEKKPSNVKLFIAILYNPEIENNKIIEILNEKFGTIEYSYGPVPFSWTEYYKKEMGENLFKLYFTYKQTIERENLPQIKNFTNKLEQSFLNSKGGRLVNIDPGYIARDKFVLASTKDFYHRIYIGSGIYGEVTLHYRGGKFRYFSWTYPDYKDEKVMQLLEKARATLVKELRTLQSV